MASSPLHDVTYGGGVGFCHDALPELLPAGYHGPLVVALDSNILIDLQDHGRLLVDGDELPPEVTRDPRYVEELEQLEGLLNLWMLRDIRFVVTPRARSDGKRIRSEEASARRLATIDSIVESLAFQTEEWGCDPSQEDPDVLRRIDARLPDGPDRDLVGEALSLGAHVFLTRDRRLSDRVRGMTEGMWVVPPSRLLYELVTNSVQPFGGGTCGRPGCPYGDGQLPAPDMGKWSGLLSALGA